MSYLHYILCLFANSVVQHILCCVIDNTMTHRKKKEKWTNNDSQNATQKKPKDQQH